MNLSKIIRDGWAGVARTVGSVEAFLERNTTPAAKAVIAADVAAVKQGASDLIALGDSMIGNALAPAGDSVVNVFNSVLQSLGYAVGGAPAAAGVAAVERMVQPFEVAGVNVIRDRIKSMVDAAALGAIAQLGGHAPIAAPVSDPAPPQAGSQASS